MLSFSIARRAVAPPCPSTRIRSDRHFPDLAGACARGRDTTITKMQEVQSIRPNDASSRCAAQKKPTPTLKNKITMVFRVVGHAVRSLWTPHLERRITPCAVWRYCFHSLQSEALGMCIACLCDVLLCTIGDRRRCIIATPTYCAETCLTDHGRLVGHAIHLGPIPQLFSLTGPSAMICSSNPVRAHLHFLTCIVTNSLIAAVPWLHTSTQAFKQTSCAGQSCAPSIKAVWRVFVASP